MCFSNLTDAMSLIQKIKHKKYDEQGSTGSRYIYGISTLTETMTVVTFLVSTNY